MDHPNSFRAKYVWLKKHFFTAPHNALDTDFPRVNRWFDVADYFEVTETFL
jgi:5'(3')-deoxyribonucleotidase